MAKKDFKDIPHFALGVQAPKDELSFFRHNG